MSKTLLTIVAISTMLFTACKQASSTSAPAITNETSIANEASIFTETPEQEEFSNATTSSTPEEVIGDKKVKPYTPTKDSPIRKAILDAVRPNANKDIGNSNFKFLVNKLETNNEVAYFSGEFGTANGAKLDATTITGELKQVIDNVGFRNNVYAYLLFQNNQWVVKDYFSGCTDVCFQEIICKLPRNFINYSNTCN